MIDAQRRLGNEVGSLIQNAQYFVIHAARQTGKTTLLTALTDQVNDEGKYYALYCSVENAQGISDPEKGVPSVINALRESLDSAGLPAASSFACDNDGFDYSTILQRSFRKYCSQLDKPLVVFFDEADCLSDQTLISFLRQLRSGYVNRARYPFVHSLGLIGMRNIRDYRDRYRSPDETLGSVSPFNIIASAMTLRNFTRDEIAELYTQHTEETGQVFEDSAVESVWLWTQGQPWLVNAIAREIVENKLKNESLPLVTVSMVNAAVQSIITRRDTHLDSLMARLKEERIRRVIEPVITGDTDKLQRLSDDYIYTKDMGLIRDDRGKVEPANQIYAEIIVRSLNWDTQQSIVERGYPYQMPRYLRDGVIDMDYLLKDFQAFWRENAAIWHEVYDYKEAAPHLVLQAFLQRVINGGGQIHREMAAETRRVDLCVEYMRHRYPIELKLRYGDGTRADGIKQLAAYMDIQGCDTGWLIIFDRRKTISWDDKLYFDIEIIDKKTILIVGC
jgi:hypothetical protein